MKKDDEKLLRQLSLLSFLLSQNRPVSAREIRRSVEGYAFMSDATFARRFFADREDLRALGLAIECVETGDYLEGQAYYLPEENYYLPAVEFSEREITALSMALTLLDGHFAYARPLRLALTALTRGRSNPVRGHADPPPLSLAPDDEARRSGRQLARLEEAVSRGKTVSFIYPGHEPGQLLTRTLDPYGLFLISGHWYVVGRDHTRDAVRTFRVGRIEGPVRFFSERTRDFTIPPGFDPNEYRARPAWLFGRPSGTATIRVDEEMAWWVDRLAPFVQAAGSPAPGYVDFTTGYAESQALLGWVVALGSRAELVEPPVLRRELRRALARVCDDHRRPPGAPAAARPGTDAPPAGGAKPRRRRGAEPEESAVVATERLARALTLLQYLLRDQVPEGAGWQQLHADLGLTREEVEADLAFINLVNFGGGTYPLYAEAGDKGVTVIREPAGDAFARPARLSPVMARALILALDLLRDMAPLEALQPLEPVRTRVASALLTAGGPGRVVVDDLLHPDESVVEVLNQALRESLVVELDYYTPSREGLTERVVEPYLLFRSGEGWYLEAWCRNAQAQRTFRLDRVRAARLTTERFAERPEVDLTPRKAGLAFSAGSNPAFALVRFPADEGRTLLERGLQVESLEGGELRARIPFLDERWLVMEVLRHLGRAILEEPATLRPRVVEAACSLAAVYSRADAQAHDDC